MDENALRWRKQLLEDSLKKIRELIEGLNTSILQGWQDDSSPDPIVKSQAWIPTAAERERMDALAALGRSYLQELAKTEKALGIVK